MNKDRLKTETKPVNFLQLVELAGYVWKGNEIGYDAGGFQRDSIICEEENLSNDTQGEVILEKNGCVRMSYTLEIEN